MGMRVGLIDIDSTIPNLALMKLSAWHKSQGDEVLLGHGGDKVYAASVFSWSKRKTEQYRAIWPEMVVGGTGSEITSELPAEVETLHPDYSLYHDRFTTWRGVGLGFLSRGCPRSCEFCLVPRKEGKPKVVAAPDDLVNPAWSAYLKRPFIVALDNNFIAMRDWALAILAEIADKGYDVCFSQGLDMRLVTPEIAVALARVRYWNLKHSGQQLTFAFDHVGVESAFRQGLKYLNEAGIKSYRVQSFVLCGFNSTFEEDLYRVETLRSLGVDPFVMVYRDPITGKAGDRKLRHFARWANRRLYKTCKWEEYYPWVKQKNQGEFSWD